MILNDPRCFDFELRMSDISDIHLRIESDDEAPKVKKLKRKRLIVKVSDDSSSDPEDKKLKCIVNDAQVSGNNTDKNGPSKHRRKKSERSFSSDSSECASKVDNNIESNEKNASDNANKQKKEKVNDVDNLNTDSSDSDLKSDSSSGRNNLNKLDSKPVKKKKKLTSRLSSDDSESNSKLDNGDKSNEHSDDSSEILEEKVKNESNDTSESSFNSADDKLNKEGELQVIQPNEEDEVVQKKKEKKKNRLITDFCDRKPKADSTNKSNEQSEVDNQSKQDGLNSEDSELKLNSDLINKSIQQSNSKDSKKQVKSKRNRRNSEMSDSSEQSLLLDVKLEEYDSAQEEEMDIDESDEENGFTIDRARTTLYNATPEEKRKLASLKVKLVHKVPRQHKIEHVAGTRALSSEQKQEFSRFSQLKRGVFTSIEDRLIKRNWLNFCNVHNWDRNNPKPFLQMRHKNITEFMKFEERMKFIRFLANGLFNRSLYSVFQRFKVLYDPHKKSRYSREEDNTIVSFVKQHKLINSRNRKFADLALILKRTRASVWRRYRVLKKRNMVDKITQDVV